MLYLVVASGGVPKSHTNFRTRGSSAFCYDNLSHFIQQLNGIKGNLIDHG